jgi:AraC-like DNA-binding protein
MAGLTASEAWQGTLEPESIRTSQLERGGLTLDRAAAEFNSVRCVSLSASVGFEGHSNLLPGRVIVGVIADPSTDARWFGEQVHSADVIQTQTSMDLTTHGGSKMYFATTAAEALEPNDGCRIHRDAGSAERLRRYLRAAIGLCAGANESDARRIERTLLPLISLCLSERSAFSASRALGRRVTAVRKCEEYVREHIEEIPTLSDLSEVSGLRMRSLINAFQAVIGMSPMTYLKVQRLNEARKTLLAVDPSETRIIDVATDWGFWHMGHFTESYRGMFGEPPSETLNKRRR